MTNDIDGLSLLKRSLKGPGERPTIVSKLLSNARSPLMSCIDIGSGDGRYINLLRIDCKEQGVELDITLVEPLSSNWMKTKRLLPEANAINSRLEDLCVSSTYSAVHCAHAAYYFCSLDNNLKKLASLAADNAPVIATVWARDCDLLKLRNASLLHAEEALNGETLVDAIMSDPSLLLVDNSVIEGPVDAKQLNSLSDLELASVLNVIARQSAVIDSATISRARQFLNDSDAQTRKNCVITFKKANNQHGRK